MLEPATAPDALLHALFDLAGRGSVRIGLEHRDDGVSDLAGRPSKRFHTPGL